MEPNIKCYIKNCTKKFYNGNSLKKHLKDEHFIKISDSYPGKFVCISGECQSLGFGKYQSFSDHIKKKHEFIVNDEAINLNKISTRPTIAKPLLKYLNYDYHAMMFVTEIRKASPSMIGADVEKVMKCFEESLRIIVDETTELFEQFLEEEKIDTSNENAKTFLNAIIVRESFTKYHTLPGQIKAMKNLHKLIEPEVINIGTKKKQVLNEKTGVYESVNVTATMAYVSPIETLKLILSNKEVYDYVKNNEYTKLHDNEEFDEFIFRSFEDSNSFKKNKLFQKYTGVIGFHSYYDDIVVNNPLGNKTNQKIGTFYFILSNIPPHLRDWIGNVHVFGFALSKDVARYGMNKCLERFVSDMKLLESDQGIPIKLHGEDFTLRASLLKVCADNLAADQTLGFLGSNAKFFCRICTITREEHKKSPFLKGSLRTQEEHNLHIEEVGKDKKMQTLSGVKFRSILDDLEYFNVVENWLLDLLHEWLEGQGEFTGKLVMAKWVSDAKYKLTVELLNKRLEFHNFGKSESNKKPSPTLTAESLANADKDHKLHETAVQTWTLLRVLPFLVSDRVSPDDEYLKILLLQNQISEILFAPKVPAAILPYLNSLIIEYQELFYKLFKDYSKINKLHQMSHFPMCFQDSGPQVLLACFKLEARHKWFKEYASRCHNYKDICLTLAKMAQILQSTTWGTNKSEVRKKISYTAFEKKHNLNDDAELLNFFVSYGLTDLKEIVEVGSVKVYGTEYHVNEFVALESERFTPESLPIFGKILKIYINKKSVYFYCQRYHSAGIDEALNAHEIIKGSKFSLLNTDELCDKRPFSIWKDYRSSQTEYICLRNILV